jgi:hypothetical protein
VLNRVFLVLLCYENRLRTTLRRLRFCIVLFMKLVKQNGNECFLLFESVSHSGHDSQSWNKKHMYELYTAILTMLSCTVRIAGHAAVLSANIANIDD